jgi:hypothetical protein
LHGLDERFSGDVALKPSKFLGSNDDGLVTSVHGDVLGLRS